MDPVCFSETLASTDESRGRQNQEQHHRDPHRRENLKYHRLKEVRMPGTLFNTLEKELTTFAFTSH
jgi:endo-1,4-beta-D-glucanase Y